MIYKIRYELNYLINFIIDDSWTFLTHEGKSFSYKSQKL